MDGWMRWKVLGDDDAADWMKKVRTETRGRERFGIRDCAIGGNLRTLIADLWLRLSASKDLISNPE